MGFDKSIVGNFKRSFEIKCFRLIIEAYNTSITEKSIQLDWNENDITAELHNYIDSNSLRAKWKISSNVEHHLPKDYIKKGKGFSAKLPRIDMRLTSYNSSLEYKYYMEAKNLKEKDSALKRRYIETGINNFVSKKYKNGSLLGYLLEGNLNLTIMGINLLLEKDKRKAEILQFKTFKFHNEYYESNHNEIGILKHLIFDFTSI